VVSIGSTEPTSRKTPLPPSKYRLMWYTDLLSSHRAAPATERERKGRGYPTTLLFRHPCLAPSALPPSISRDLSSLFPRLSCIPFLLVFFISLALSLLSFRCNARRYVRLFNLFVFFSHMRVYSNLILQRLCVLQRAILCIGLP